MESTTVGRIGVTPERRIGRDWYRVSLSLLVTAIVALAGSLAWRWTRENTAGAQVQRPADYLMIPGEVQGGPSAVVYILDASNGQLGAMAYDQANHQLGVMTPLNLIRIFNTNQPAGGRGH